MLLKRIERKFTNKKLIFLKKKAATDKRLLKTTKMVNAKQLTTNLNDLKDIDILVPASTVDNTVVSSAESSEFSLASESVENVSNVYNYF